jgi:hypothetical protein
LQKTSHFFTECGPATIDPKEGTWKWLLTFPMGPREGKVRYSIKISDSTWEEYGEVAVDDGTTWNKNFEMKLTKTQDSCSGF